MEAFKLKDYQAVGFAGCWMAESGCDPTKYNKEEKAGTFKGSTANGDGYGAGLAQWSNAWKKTIQQQFNRYTPIETWTLDQQIEIVTKGCTQNFIQLLRNSTSASESTDIILRGYENGSCGKGTTLRSQNSMKSYTWCKNSYVPYIGYRDFPDGYIGALTERTAWANKVLEAMGSKESVPLNIPEGSSFADSASYENFSGSGGNIFSSSAANSFVQASASENNKESIVSTDHTRIYSTNDACIVLDELSMPLDTEEGA